MDRSWPPRRSGFISTASVHNSPERYREVLKQITQRGNYVPVPRTLANALGLDAAASLMNLVAGAQLRADPDGWMQCTSAYLCHGLGISAEREAVAVNCLRDHELIEVRERGGSRQLRVNLRKLMFIFEGE